MPDATNPRKGTKPTVYVETSIVSYLAARPSRDVIVAGQLQATHQWWASRRIAFELVVSAAVVQEASLGDPDAAQRRVALMTGLRSVPLDDAVEALARIIAEETGLPRKAAIDALHVAAAAANKVDYLLTWNCTHLASAVFRPRIESICRNHGYEPPVICTPLELS